MNKIPFTEVGYQDLLEEKKQLEEKRNSAVSELSTARDMGDRSENAFYKTARQKLSGIDRRLREINRLIKFAKITKPTADGTVQIGSEVTVKDGEQTSKYLIVGGYESDLTKGRISCYSPIGKALMGKREGDKIVLQVPNGKKTLSIIRCSASL